MPGFLLGDAWLAALDVVNSSIMILVSIHIDLGTL